MEYCKCKTPVKDSYDGFISCKNCDREIEPAGIREIRILRIQLEIAVNAMEYQSKHPIADSVIYAKNTLAAIKAVKG